MWLVHRRKCQSIHRLASPPRKNPVPITKKRIRAKRWFGTGFVLNLYVMVLCVKEANIAAAPRTRKKNDGSRSMQMRIYTILQETVPDKSRYRTCAFWPECTLRVTEFIGTLTTGEFWNEQHACNLTLPVVNCGS